MNNALKRVFGQALLSFIMIGIYWNNHHHMLHATQQINGRILWANLYLLFWLSLIPFVTAWMGSNHFAMIPVILYGVVLVMAATAYYILAHTIIHFHGKNSALAVALGKDFKGIISIVIYFIAIVLALINPFLALAGYILVAIIWIVPDRRIEKQVKM